jgi:hypothetical protein
MAGAWTTLAILDGGGTSRTMRVWDESGSGGGPFSFGQMQADGSGSGVSPAIKAASTAPLATDPAMVVAISPNSVNTNGSKASGSSAPVVIASDQATIAVAADATQLMDGVSGAALTPLFAKIVASSSGATTVISAVSGKKIVVLAMAISANAAVNVKWQSHVTPTDLTGLLYCGGQGDGEVLPFNPVGWFETVAGEALDINLSAGTAVGGHITYVTL